jgi:hypothetical protein
MNRPHTMKRPIILMVLYLMIVNPTFAYSTGSSVANALALQETPDSAVTVFVADFDLHELRQRMEANASAILSEINRSWLETGEPEFERIRFSSNFTEQFGQLWENTPFFITDGTIIETVSRLTDGYYELRNIPMKFHGENGEEYYEEGVMQFTPSGLVHDLRIGLAAHRYQELLRQGEDQIDTANRQMILTFVENFRTAYNRRDLDFIQDVFSEQALIIVGRVVENTRQLSPMQQQVEYLRFTKDEYVQRLRTIFAANTWIDVGFSNIRILRHPRHQHMYGVNLTQYYNSSIYSDVGYLFLLIDFRDAVKPVIHVRTWQPQRSTPETEIFILGDMEIF